MFKKYRILEVGGKFIPQIRESLFGNYEGIDITTKDTWVKLEAQISYCAHDTIEEAKNVIKIHDRVLIIHKY
jgi:hypothetical protein